MASSLAAARRVSARLAQHPRVYARALSTSAPSLAAHNFTMPALSPTMTEGNIASWKVRDGQSFSAGDVLLEIETDKANMDVEAQDDGVMVKIFSDDGAKAVQVGARIAVVADAGDDVSALEMPADEAPKQPQQQQQQNQDQEQDQKPKDTASSSSLLQSSSTMQTADSSSGPGTRTPAGGAGNGTTHKHKFPLMPAVEHLVKRHAIAADQLATIAPTGPGGRLLKGDVLAHLGAIAAEAPAALSSRLDKLAHLDLSNIKVAQSSGKPDPATVDVAAAAAAAAAASSSSNSQSQSKSQPQSTRVQVPVSLAHAVAVQGKIQEALEIFIPLSTFIERAADAANQDLPAVSRAPKTSAQLFDAILGIDSAAARRPSISRGTYSPSLSVLPPTALTQRIINKTRSGGRATRRNIIDELAAPSRVRSSGSSGGNSRRHGGGSGDGSGAAAVSGLSGSEAGQNVFTLTVPREEQQRARVFLERCKTILEEEPGRLLL